MKTQLIYQISHIIVVISIISIIPVPPQGGSSDLLLKKFGRYYLFFIPLHSNSHIALILRLHLGEKPVITGNSLKPKE